MSALLSAAMLALLAGALLPLVAPRAAAAVSVVGCVALVVVGFHATVAASPTTIDIGSWLGFGDTGLRADGLAGLFLVLTGITGGAVAAAHIELSPGRRLTALNGALILVTVTAVLADGGFLFLMAWELLAVCIILLTGAGAGRPGALGDATLTAALTKLGGGALLAAVGLLAARTGSVSFEAWARAAPGLGGGTRDALFVLFVIAFGTKVGLVPLQGALPAGYGAAPRLGAASLSVALCAGFYGLWRLVVELLAPAPLWWGEALLVVGAVTAVAGVTYALTQDDMRRFLGFSTVEHAGIVAVALGVALIGQSTNDQRLVAAGLLAATLHVIAHGIAKTLGLVVADRLEVATGSRDLDGLGGLWSRMRASTPGLALACFTLAAIPPFGGFVSEWFVFEALLQSFRVESLAAQMLCALAAAAIAFTAGLGLLAFAKLLGFGALGPARSAAAARAHEPATGFSVAALGTVALCLGVVAPWEIHLLGQGLAGTIGFDPADAVISHPLVLGPVFADFSVLAPTWLAIVLPCFAAMIAAIALARRPGGRREPVWVSGSGAPITAVQYRPSSYVNPIRVVLRGPLGFRRTVDADADGALHVTTTVTLAVDRLLYAPLARGALWTAARVRRLQSGRLGDYLLYLLAVAIVLLALVPAVS